MHTPARSDTTVAVSDFSTTGNDAGGPIRKVLVLNGDADSALGSLLYNIESLGERLVELGVPSNQREALLDLRKAAYGY